MLRIILKRNKAIATALTVAALFNSIPIVAANAVTSSTTASVSAFDPTNFLTEAGWVKYSDTGAYLSSVTLSPYESKLSVNGSDYTMINTGAGIFGSAISAPAGSKIYLEFRDTYIDWQHNPQGSQNRYIVTMPDTESNYSIYFNGGRSSGSHLNISLIPMTFDSSEDTPNFKIANAQETLLNAIIDDTTTATQLQTLAQAAVPSKYSVSVTQQSKTNPTESTDGNFKGTITVTDTTSGEQATSTFSLTIPKLSQSLSTISTSLNNFINNYNATNSSKASDFQSAVAITNTAYNVSVGNWSLIPATDTNIGNLSCKVYINEGSTVRQTFTVNKTISKLATTTATAKTIVQGIVDNYVATNSSDKTSFLNALKNAVGNNITVTISTWTLTQSTETSKGSLVGTVSINDGTTTQTIAINKSIGYLDQSISTAQTNVQAVIDNLSPSNYITQNEVLNIAKSAVDSNYFNLTVSGFSNINSTESTQGSIVGTITIIDKSNSSNTRTVTLNKIIPVLSQTIDNAEMIVQNILSSYSVNNDTAQDEMLNNINKSINTNYITASIQSFDLTQATETSKGNLNLAVKLSDQSGSTRTVSKDYVIGVQEQSLDTIYSMLDNYCTNYNANNSSKETDLTKAIVITNSNYSVDVDSWSLTPSSDTLEGNLSCNLNIGENGVIKKTIQLNKTISKLATTTETAKAIIQAIVDNYVATNSADKTSFLNALKNAVGNSITISIPSWDCTLATETTRGSLVGTIQISDGATTDTVEINKTIEVEKQSVQTVQSLFEKALSDMKITNDTVANDILDNVLITNQNIKVQMNNFKVTAATEAKSGLITGSINILDGTTSEDVSVNLKIAQLQQSIYTVRSLFEKRLANFVATNGTIEDDILDLVYVNNEDISVSIDNFSVLQSTDTEKGAVTGTIKITDGTTTKEVEINKPIEVLSQELSTSIRLVQNVINTYNTDNNSTFDKLLIACNDVVSQNIDAYYKVNGQLQKIDSTEFEDGSMIGTMVVTDGNTIIELPFEITISKLPQTLQGAKTLITACLSNFNASNATTAQNILNAVETNVRSNNINVAFGNDEESFSKTLATGFAKGSIKGTINVSDGANTLKIPVDLVIAQLDQTIAQAEQGINVALPNFAVTNDSTADDIKNQIENVVSSNIYVTIKDFKKTEATLQADGNIQTTVILVDKNTGNSKEISLTLTIKRLQQTLDEAKSTVTLALPNITVTNNTTVDTMKSDLQNKVGENIKIDVQDFNKSLATISENGNIAATILITDSITGNSTSIPVNLTIQKLQQTLDEAKNSVEQALPTLPVSNDTTKEDLQNQLQDKVGDNITIIIGDGDFNKTPAKTITPGKITGVVTIVDNNTGSKTTIPIDLNIGKLAAKPSSGGGGGGSSSNKDKSVSTQDQTGNIKNGAGTCEWKNENGSWHYYISGVIQIGWIQIEGLWYYFNIDGVLQMGWLYDTGNWYYLNPNPNDHLGAMETGWLSYNGGYFYLNSSGAMARGWRTIDGNWYYFQSSGALKTGWLKNTDGNWYYLNLAKGAMVRGWQNINGSWYYLEASGAMKTDWFYDNGNWYYLTNSGNMATGWFKDSNDNWYYADQSGAMLRSRIVDGYNLDDQGRLI